MARGSSTTASLLLTLALLTIPVASVRAEEYRAGNRYEAQNATTWNVITSTPQAHWDLSNENLPSHGYIRSRYATADRSVLEGYYWVRKYNGFTVAPDQHPLARMEFTDVVFQRSDGAPSVEVSLNLRIDATSHFDPMPADIGGIQGVALLVTTNTSTPAVWAAASGDDGVNSGPFVGQNADELHGVFTFGPHTFPTNTPVTLRVETKTRVSNCCAYTVTVAHHSVVRLPYEYEGTGRVFEFLNLPPGVTCSVNSAQANISGNTYPEPTPVEPVSWGGIKRMYR